MALSSTERWAAYYALNHERLNARRREYSRAHRAGDLAQNRRWRAANPEKVRAIYLRNRPQLRANKKKRIELAQAFIDAARAGGCVDCGNKNLTVLHSDHVNGSKLASVSQMVNRPLSLLFAELDKCETRCANCHMIVTVARRKVA